MLENKYAESIRTNRVLLALVFVALVLLGPAFTMGYMSGYRSGRAVGPATASEPAPAASQESALPPQTMAKQSTRTEPRKPSAERADRPAAGHVYLQLVTTAESQSAVIVDGLRNKGFPALVTEVPKKSGLRRVLIGPIPEGELDKTRAELQSRGFPGDSAIKRTF